MIDLTTVQTFADADILNILRLSLVSSSIAQSHSINGRMLSQVSPVEIQKLITQYEWRIYRAQNGLFVVAQNRQAE